MIKMNKGLLTGSLILLVTINIFNILNLFYNISMARLLSLADYGVLTTLIYIVIIFAVFSESIQTVISRYTTKEKNPAKVKNIFIRSIKKGFYISLFVFVIFAAFGLFLSEILKISYPLIVLTGAMIFTSFLTPVTRGILQGRKKFSSLGFNMIAEALIKLAFALVLVLIGIGVFGAVVGILAGSLLAFLLSLTSIKDILSQKEKQSKTIEIYSYARPVFITTLSIVLFLSTDIILAKIFFQPEVVGAYAIASTIAKIIFIGSQPISKAMFPISTENEASKNSKKILLNSFLILGAIIFISLLITYLIPGFLVRIYSGKNIVIAASILFYLAIGNSLLSLTNLSLLYGLSKGGLKNYWALLIFVAVEIILLSMFHDSLLQYSMAFIAASAIFLWGSVILFKQ